MACISHQPNLSTGTATCSAHRPVNSSASPIVTAPAVGATVTAAQINALRSAIRTEITRWQQHSWYTNVTANVYFPQTANNLTVGSKATFPHPTVDAQDNTMIMVGGAGYPGTTTKPNTSAYPPAATITPAPDVAPALTDYSFPVGNNITAANYQAMLNSYNALRADCICNTDCNCNAVCSCHGNCGCNYSDMRLKKEICYC